jgi:putative transposase
MHSIEYRLRGVQFRIKLDKRIGLSIRQVGSPTKNALKSWHGEYEQRLGRPAGYARQPRYPQAQKERAVGRYLDHGRCIAATIRALGHPSRSLLAAWLQDLNSQARTGVVGRSQKLAPAVKQSAVIALCMRSASAQAVAEGLGESRGSLYECMNHLLGHDVLAPLDNQQDAPASPDRAKLEQQLETLQRDVRRLQLDKDLLNEANERQKENWASTGRT